MQATYLPKDVMKATYLPKDVMKELLID